MSRAPTLLEGATLSDVTDSDGSVGADVVRLRSELGWSQLQLADAAGVSEPQVANIENGRVKTRRKNDATSKVLEALAEAQRSRRGTPHAPSPESHARLMELLTREAEVLRFTRSASRKGRWLTAYVPDDDATEDDIARDLEEWAEDHPNG
jgi:transcriptional regulator with XRE-family HTH domain